jgi:tetratricopeptide (TPR) repeat protein
MSLDRFYSVRKRLLIYIAAGPAVGFVLAAVAIACLRAAVDGDRPRLSLFFGALAGSALLSSIRALSPSYSGPLANDGLQLKVLLRSRDGTKRLLAVHALDLHRRKGTDQLCLNPRWWRLASSGGEPMDSRFSKYAEAWDAYRIADSEERAAEFLESCLATSAFLGEENRDVLILEAAVFTARVRHDSERASIWFERAVNLPRIPSLTRLRAQATLSYEAGRFDDAIGQVEEGLDFLRRTSVNGMLDGQEAAWLKWRAEIESRRDQQAVPA